ncbi:hypothetical protein K435DRAFT_778071 [Dendrothele bispora CBS 962.96]|uniref:LysM domain-containing protein n=1 Tax=Dendrothele bispora (strain CBS 962.96) TaxID=1314807 RepID=A0A4S8M5A0_DENBC|nr:hypothetical protein K435DRAFT_778071 [Dendrothele bispora CBS 962.96]
MGRWTQYDEDSYRLPEGMERIGYDSDSGRYIFRERNGSTWQSEPGTEFGPMTRLSQGPSSNAHTEDDDDGDVEAHPLSGARSDGYQRLPMDSNPIARRQTVNTAAFRQLFPFFLIIAVVILLVFRFIVYPNLGSSGSQDPCPNPNTLSHIVEPGESCWVISQANGCSLEELEEMNGKVDCEKLMPGQVLCLPLQVNGLEGGQ